MKAFVFAVPGDLSTPTGGYVYDRRVIAELPALGWQVEALNIGEGFPLPSDAVRATAVARLAAVPDRCPIVIDGLAFGVLPDAAQVLAPRHPLIALVHHPLAFETGLGDDEAAAFRASERAALSKAHSVIATSAATANLLVTEFDVPRARLTVVRPGTDRVTVSPRAPRDIVTLLAVGAVVPRKGYDVLIAALSALKALPWRLIIAGDRSRDPATAAQLDADIARYTLDQRIELLGPVAPERLSALYAEADLFVLASRFEGYGMAYTEAIAHGVPVVGTLAGAIVDTVPSGAGVLVPPDDVDGFAAALRRLIENPDERNRFAAGARAATFPTWRESATLFAQVLDGVA